MVIARRRNGTLMFFNAVPMLDETLAAIARLGTPDALIVPNWFHALDAHAFCERLKVTPFAPAIAIARLQERTSLACRPVTELPLDDDMALVTVDGFKTDEAALIVGDTLIVADVMTNARHEPGMAGWMMKLVGFTGTEPRLPKPVRMRVGRSLPKVRALLEQLAQRPGLSRIIPSHGEVVESNAPAALRAVAATL